MAYSVYDLTEAEEADLQYAQSLRSTELADDLKCRIAHAVNQWMYVNGVQLNDPMWASFGARSQECLETLVLRRLFDVADDIAADFLASAQ